MERPQTVAFTVRVKIPNSKPEVFVNRRCYCWYLRDRYCTCTGLLITLGSQIL
jgi:hypothetical protein